MQAESNGSTVQKQSSENVKSSCPYTYVVLKRHSKDPLNKVHFDFMPYPHIAYILNVQIWSRFSINESVQCLHNIE